VARENKQRERLVLPPTRLVTTVVKRDIFLETAGLLAQMEEDAVVAEVDAVLASVEGVASIAEGLATSRRIVLNPLETSLATIVARKAMSPRIALTQGTRTVLLSSDVAYSVSVKMVS